MILWIFLAQFDYGVEKCLSRLVLRILKDQDCLFLCPSLEGWRFLIALR